MNSHPSLDDRLTTNWQAIVVELDAPPASRTERLARWVGVPEPVARLGAATPALRRSWWLAMVIALFFGMAASGSGEVDDPNRLLVYLTVAPLIPLLGVALAYGPNVDPSHEQASVTPQHGLRLLLIRAVTVLGFSVIASFVAGVLLQAGLAIGAWIVPAVALSLVTLVLGERFSPMWSAGAVAIGWLLIVMVTALASSDDVVAFRAVGQLIALLVAVGAAIVLYARRRQYAVSRQLP